jgi:hypothetical protein
MTDRAINEAEEYVERSLKAQEKLGYSTPDQPVVKAAVSEAAQAVDALMTLQASQQDSH